MAKNKKSGLGRGLDSLIPTNFYDENFDSNSSLSLEDMLEDKSEEGVTEDNSEKSLEEVKTEDSEVVEESSEDSLEEVKTEDSEVVEEGSEDSEEIIDESNFDEEEISEEGTVVKEDSDLVGEEISNSEEIIDESTIDEDIESEDLEDNSIVITPEIQEHIQEVGEIVKKNPRITLWSVQSASVFRYLRKTKPEFSISKEASSLIDEAVSKKYPEIWKLFDEN